MDELLMEELENYRATAALKLSGVNMVEIIEDRTKDVIHLTEENKRQKEWNKRLNRRLSVATTERDKLEKELKEYKMVLDQVKKFLNNELELQEFTHIPTFIDYMNSLGKVVRK